METVKIEESEYCRGFADATGLGIDEAAEQISAMGNYEVDDWDNFDEGFRDGLEFNKAFLYSYIQPPNTVAHHTTPMARTRYKKR